MRARFSRRLYHARFREVKNATPPVVESLL